MGTHYEQLSQAERIEIYRLLESGCSQARIASEIDRARSTIYREIKRNAKETKQYHAGYEPLRAQARAERRRQRDHRFKLERQPALQKLVRKHLAMGWSPKQIEGRLAVKNAPMRISAESIYRFIYHRVAQKDYWNRLLPRRKSRRGKLSRGGVSAAKFIKQRRTLDERPEAANQRAEFGHWEADLMSFSKYAEHLLVLHERTSRIVRIIRIVNKTAVHVADKIAHLLAPLPSLLKASITFDNGTEFANHYTLHKSLGVETFFCDTHSPWQKGGVENAIGRARRWLPRKTNLAETSHQKIRAIADKYNNTPRQCLGFWTPNEVFNSVALQP